MWDWWDCCPWALVQDFLGAYAEEWCASRLGRKHHDSHKCWCGQGSSPLQLCHMARWCGHLLVVTISQFIHIVALSIACQRTTYLLDQTSYLLNIRPKEKGHGKEAYNPPSSSSICNSSYRPEPWSLNGGGEKGLNEQSERYLQLPPLTWATTVAIGRHPCAGPLLFISACWPTVRGIQAGPNWRKAICFF